MISLEKYAPLTLTSRNQHYKLSDLDHSTTKDPNRLLTQKMRQAGTTLADLHYYIPKNAADYQAIQTWKTAIRAERERTAAAAKAAAAWKAAEELANIVPNMRNDGMMFNADEFDDDIMLDTAATVYPAGLDIAAVLLKLKEFQ